MDYTKRIILVGLTILIVIGVSGCMKKKNRYTPEGIKEMMLAYLEEKYDEEFVPISLTMENWAYKYDSLRVYPKNGNREDFFEVTGSRRDDGTYRMRDGYFKYIIKDAYEAQIREYVSEYYDDIKIFTRISGSGVYDDRLNKSTKLSEVYDIDPNYRPAIDIFVKEDVTQEVEASEILRAVANRLIEDRLPARIKFYIVYEDKFPEASLDFLKLHHTEFPKYVKEERKLSINSKLELYGER
ncbi:hypothetical protein [Alkaliphilus transvaalensis]|uniref:hypothetical protein n=1 Tax=Alkaliphilus transvaalensis TaxID=114628 RepID=UPI00047943B5|nr:hypothetical protein [Alkaliphilus transvaalensis]